MYALCVAGAVNTQVFVSKFFYAIYIYIYVYIYIYILFIHSFSHIHVETPQAKTFFLTATK